MQLLLESPDIICCSNPNSISRNLAVNDMAKLINTVMAIREMWVPRLATLTVDRGFSRSLLSP